MTKILGFAKYAAVALVAAASPAIVIFGVPFAIGIGQDLFATAWLAPLSLCAGAAVALNAARRDVTQAAKSIT